MPARKQDPNMCPACLGRGWAMVQHYALPDGKTYSQHSNDQCETCGGTGSTQPIKKRSKSDKGVVAKSLGKLLNVRPNPTARRYQP